jgi:hypothetical protein
MSIPYGSLRFIPVFTAHIFTTERRSERRGFNTEITENTEEEEKENALRAAKNLCVLCDLCVSNPFIPFFLLTVSTSLWFHFLFLKPTPPGSRIRYERTPGTRRPIKTPYS